MKRLRSALVVATTAVAITAVALPGVASAGSTVRCELNAGGWWCHTTTYTPATGGSTSKNML